MLFSGDPLYACTFHPLALHLARANKPNLITTLLLTLKAGLIAKVELKQPNISQLLLFIRKNLDQAHGNNQAATH
jgi:hypothetical protein